ncbi:hypothetical protein [Amycolatopsis thermoflava]|uniref:hypothetical protein n=1 Tax=Amycolatopsis thermoflava TaxID=84480 RepID=UPI003D75974D
MKHVFPPGEVLVASPHEPAFPGIPASQPTAVSEDRRREIGLRCRRSVTQWIGIYQEAVYGGAQIRYDWQGDVVHIHDDPWGFSQEPQPRVIRPDDDGRYEIRDVWFALASPLSAQLQHRHGAALAVLAGNAPPRATPEMLTYLTDWPRTGRNTRDNLEKLLARVH